MTPQEALAHGFFDELEKIGKKLTTKARDQISEGNFALPGRRYPIEDQNHARNALARVSQHGSESEKAQVRAAVHRKYPGIGKEASSVGAGIGGLVGALGAKRDKRWEGASKGVVGGMIGSTTGSLIGESLEHAKNPLLRTLGEGPILALLGSMIGGGAAASSTRRSHEKVALVGAATGALTAGEGRRWPGAGLGFLGGDVLGGALGNAAGLELGLLTGRPGLAFSLERLGGLGGRVGGGYLAGKALQKKK